MAVRPEQPVALAAMPVAEVMRRWPSTTAVFRRRGLGCLGCPLGPLCTVADVARIYAAPLTALVAELEAAIRDAP